MYREFTIGNYMMYRSHIPYVMSDIQDLVREDPDCLPVEKESSFLINKDEKVITVSTAIASHMRALIRSEVATIIDVTVFDGEARVTKDDLDLVRENEKIICMNASIPRGSMKIKEAERKHDGLGTIFSC